MKRGNHNSWAAFSSATGIARDLAEFQFRAAGGADPRRMDAERLGLVPDGKNLLALGIEIERDDVAALVLAEEDGNRVRSGEAGDRRADARRHRHFGERDGEPAVGDIVHGGGDAAADQLAHEIADALLMRQIDRRRRAVGAAVDVAHIDRLREMRAPGGRRADEAG